MKIIIPKLLILLTLLPNIAHGNQIHTNKTILGLTEEVLIFKEKMKLKAKLDTGATISSLSAINIKKIRSKKTGKMWVSFQTIDPDTGKLVNKKFPVKRYTRIKQHSKKQESHKYMKRPSIMLPICLGNKRGMIEVNLVDRRKFQYPLLLGSSTLRLFNVIVDPSKEFTSIPQG